KKEESAAHVLEQRMTIDSDYFFREGNGFMTAQSFIEYITSLKKHELEGLQQFFSDISQSVRLRIPGSPSVDKQGNPYYWVAHVSKKVVIEYKLIINDAMDHLLKLYSQDRFLFDLSLDGLFQIANNDINGSEDEA